MIPMRKNQKITSQNPQFELRRKTRKRNPKWMRRKRVRVEVGVLKAKQDATDVAAIAMTGMIVNIPS
jgi:hypothetical protein